MIEPHINAEGKHTWPFDPVFPVDVGHLIFNSEGEIRMNRHDYYELLFVHSGEIEFQVQDRLYPLSEGDLFVMGSTLYHRPISRKGVAAKAVTLFFLPEAIHSGEASVDDVEYQIPFSREDSSFPHVIEKRTGLPLQLRQLVGQIETELGSGLPHSRLYTKTCLKMILAMLLKHYAPWLAHQRIVNRKDRDLARLRPLFEEMDRQFPSRIALHEAAAIVNMSKSHFVRFFKQVTSYSFAVYMNQFRIAKAQVLLRTTDQSIAEVAWNAGFCDQSNFGTVFRRFVHMTPHQFRQCALTPEAESHPVEIPSPPEHPRRRPRPTPERRTAQWPVATGEPRGQFALVKKRT